MAQLGGRQIRTTIQSLEILSDDGNHVIMIDQIPTGGTTVVIRKTYETAWANEGIKFTLPSRESRIIATAIGNTDAQYQYSDLMTVPSMDFRAENPEEAKSNEPDCTQLDIERAKAANLAEEKELLRLNLIRDHTLDKHVGNRVEGCQECDSDFISFENSDAEEEEEE